MTRLWRARQRSLSRIRHVRRLIVSLPELNPACKKLTPAPPGRGNTSRLGCGRLSARAQVGVLMDVAIPRRLVDTAPRAELPSLRLKNHAQFARGPLPQNSFAAARQSVASLCGA